MPRMSPLIFPSPSSSPFPPLALLQIARHAMANFRDIVLDPIKVEESESLAVGDTPNNPILISATPSPVLWGCFHRAPESDPITSLFRSLSLPRQFQNLLPGHQTSPYAKSPRFRLIRLPLTAQEVRLVRLLRSTALLL